MIRRALRLEPRAPGASPITVRGWWLAAISLIGAILYVLPRHPERYPWVLVSVLVFGLVPVLLPRLRPYRIPVLCPLNWAIGLFFVQLVILPLLLLYKGPFHGQLPFLPSRRAINLALALSCLSYCGFAVGYHYRGSLRAQARRGLRDGSWLPPERVAVVAFAVLGIVGLVLAFHTPGALIAYFRKSGHAGVPTGLQNLVRPSGLAYNLSLVMRPFLGFAVVLAWSNWIDRRPSTAAWRVFILTALAIAGLLFTYSTYSYNRAAFVAPLIAVAAVVSERLWRLRLAGLVAVAAVGLVVLSAYRVYRTSDFSLGQALGSKRSAILKRTDVNAELQTYAAGPQFTGYLIQQTDYGRHLYLGRTLLGSALTPVPKLGTPFRSESGVAVYNRLVYGDIPSQDQIVPFEGELFINFSFVGVAVGFILLGMLFAALQRRFTAALSAIELFVWQYAATWIGFLVVGGLAVVSQIFIYFFWPAYVLLWWSRRPRPNRFIAPSPGTAGRDPLPAARA